MTHIYSDTFFDYIDQGARRSAQQLLGLLGPWLAPTSVLDLGSGRGVWLDEWRKTGVADVLAVDGDYVNRDQLAVPREDFMAADLTAPVFTDRRFDLAQSLEVGEHLPTSASETLVDSLTRASDRVLFSAAVTGQGGEFHVNEQPLSFWQDLFAARGYTAYDCIRPHLAKNRDVEPWYRYNAVLYVNEAGRKGLPESVTKHAVPQGAAVQNGGDAIWRLRRAVVSTLPRGTVTRIAQVRARIIAMNAPGKTGAA
ncbi:class I SAM-dependent methyltransferase [Pseudosulfitobacter koreensis]|uniref:Class I SAM-dependent methyltransferase n=1 Tax=Pseudosulfitobacter koreensis TaxID=2968472 RepID=A0ABT1Z3F0_9RHOB|nr:class I SAM-dependent methyltransferase [Pseudosulfitobacter koreense]MCR8827656.1 class I SAM-dependent methyltransferase [Pseudosulfitobacter koreense]